MRTMLAALLALALPLTSFGQCHGGICPAPVSYGVSAAPTPTPCVCGPGCQCVVINGQCVCVPTQQPAAGYYPQAAYAPTPPSSCSGGTAGYYPQATYAPPVSYAPGYPVYQPVSYAPPAYAPAVAYAPRATMPVGAVGYQVVNGVTYPQSINGIPVIVGGSVGVTTPTAAVSVSYSLPRRPAIAGPRFQRGVSYGVAYQSAGLGAIACSGGR